MIKNFSLRHRRCAALALALTACLPAVAQAQHGAVPAVYATQAEAEKAASTHFNCTGAHRMGHQWMPCSQHGGKASTQHHH